MSRTEGLDQAVPPVRWLHAGRVRAWSAIFLVVAGVLFGLLTLQMNGVILPVGPASIDFVSFYAAGKLVLAGTPALAYDQAAHYVAEQQATAPGVPYVFFFYPPMFLLICAAFATLPYLLAWAVFQGVTLALFLGVMRRIVDQPGRGWMLPVLAFPATLWTIGQGQCAFLTGALLGGATLLADRRPVGAGMLVGALCFKPHLGLLTPVALAFGRRWAAFAAAVAMVLGFMLLSVAVLGAETWWAYLQAMAGADAVYTSGRINFAGFVSLFGAARLLGLGVGVAYLVQAIGALAAAAAVAWVWRSPASTQAGRAAVLLSATLVALPLALYYDQMFAVVAVGWLLRGRGPSRLSGWEAAILVACYPLALVAPIIAIAKGVSLGVLVSLAVAAISLRQRNQG